MRSIRASALAAFEEIRDTSGNEKVSLMLAELAVRAEVRGLAEEFRGRYDRLDILVNNAGLTRSKHPEPDRHRLFRGTPRGRDRLRRPPVLAALPRLQGLRDGGARQRPVHLRAQKRLWEISQELTNLKVAS